MNVIKSYFPLLASLALLGIIAIFVPWPKVFSLLFQIDPQIFLLLFGLGVLYYAAKIFRFWLMLHKLGLRAGLWITTLCYLSAQPASLLPGGELYRTVLLKKFAGVDITKSSPTVTMQGLIEGFALLIVALIGALILGKERLPILILFVLMLLGFAAIRYGRLARYSGYLNKLPFVEINRQKLRAFFKGQERLLKPSTLAQLFLISLIPVVAGVGIVYLSSRSTGGHLSLFSSAIVYCFPVVLSGLSFLPAGLGASEGGSIGILSLLGVAVPEAIVITLIVRIFTLGTGLLLGLIGSIVANLTLEAKDE